MRTDSSLTTNGTDRWYYSDANSRPVGPVSLGEIRWRVFMGKIGPTPLVIPEGGAEWVPLSKARTVYRSHIPPFDWHSRRGVALLLILVPPWGLVRLWRGEKFGLLGKLLLTVPTGLFTLPIFLAFIIAPFSTQETKHRTSPPPPPPPPPASQAKQETVSAPVQVKASAPKAPERTEPTPADLEKAKKEAVGLYIEMAALLIEMDTTVKKLENRELNFSDYREVAKRHRIKSEGIKKAAEELTNRHLYSDSPFTNIGGAVGHPLLLGAVHLRSSAGFLATLIDSQGKVSEYTLRDFNESFSEAKLQIDNVGKELERLKKREELK